MDQPPYPIWSPPRASRFPEPAFTVFRRVVGLDDVELRPIHSLANGPAIVVAASGSGLSGFVRAVMAPWQMLAGQEARENVGELALRRLAGKQAPFVLPADDETVALDLQAELGDRVDPVEVRVIAGQARVEIEDMLALVDAHHGAAVIKIARALLQVADDNNLTDMSAVLENDRLRARVYALVFGARGLPTWQHKAAMVAGRITGLPVAKLLEAFRTAWDSNYEAAQAALKEVLPNAEDRQVALALAAYMQFKVRGEEIFPDAA